MHSNSYMLPLLMGVADRRSSECFSESLSISTYEPSLILLQPGFLILPNLIVNKILGFLTSSDTLTLRQTCRTTKSWVETRFLDKMCVNVKSRSAFLTVLKSQTSWTNFMFHWKLSPSQKQLSQFTALFSEHITTLQFNNSVLDSAIIKILCSCPSLRTLVILEIDGTTLAELGADRKARVTKACANLEHLGVHEILSDDKKGALFFINYMLSVCAPSLKSLVIPFLTFSPISAYPFKYAWDKNNLLTSTTPTDILVIRPIIEILEDKVKTPNLESIIVVPESRSSLSDSALFCLTLLCYNRKINLVYDKLCDTILNLGKLKYALSAEHKEVGMSEIASKIMTAMASTTDLLLNYRFNNLRKLVVQFTTFHIDQDIFVVPQFPQLNTLHFDFKIRKQLHPRCSKVKRMNMFFQGVLEMRRPSVKQLQIQNHSVVESAIGLNVHKLVNCFHNLRSLSLVGFNGCDKDFVVIWRSLRLLEKVELENCPGLNDKGILGEDWLKPAILELTDFRDLRITRSGRITDLSYIIALSRMRLIKFHHEPLYESDVTFEGYNSLASGDFSKTVKFLSGSTTHYGRRSKMEILEYLVNFQYLQASQRKQILKGFSSRWKSLNCSV